MPAAPAPLRLPAWAWGALALVLGFVYLRGISSDPLRWEEPRRALVAAEMIHRQDYVVPRLLGEPYLNKPPMHGWLIVLFAGGEARGVCALSLRLPSVLAVVGIAVLLFRLGLSSTTGPHPLPALVFLSLGILPQYGRPGEIDLPFVFWVTGALAAFEAGRRSSSGGVQWILSQVLAAAGVLTKGFAPLFFHPPALFFLFRRRLALRPLAMAAGFLLMVAIVGAWVLPYARSGPVQALGERLASEVTQRTTAGAGEALRHVALYPLVLLAAAAPWSLALLPLAGRRGRHALRELVADPWLALCAAVLAWGALVFAFVPGTLPRYLIPVLPAASTLAAALAARLDRPSSLDWPWWVLAGAWALATPLVAWRLLAPVAGTQAGLLAALTTALGLLAASTGREVARRFGLATGTLLAGGLLYALAYAGVAEVLSAERHRAFVAAAEELAPLVRTDVPVVVREGTDRRFTWPLAHRLDRLLVERPPDPPYDLVGPDDAPLPPRTREMARSGGFALWRVKAARQEAAPPGGGGR